MRPRDKGRVSLDNGYGNQGEAILRRCNKSGKVSEINFAVHRQHSADAADNLTALKKTSTWEQAAHVEKGGWATMPGSKAADSGVSQACAVILSSLK
jgi:hypothetical protein